MPNSSRQFRLQLIDKDLSPIEKNIIESLCMGKTIKEITYEIYRDSTKRGPYYHQVEKIKIKLKVKTTEHAVATYTLRNPEIVKQLLERVK